MEPSIIISGCAFIVSFFGLVVQSKELRLQRKQLEQSTSAQLDIALAQKDTAKSQEDASNAQNKQFELHALNNRLQAEIYLHDWNTRRSSQSRASNNIEDADKHDDLAQKNMKKIIWLRGRLNKIDENIS